jgi:hypothetical protein
VSAAAPAIPKTVLANTGARPCRSTMLTIEPALAPQRLRTPIRDSLADRERHCQANSSSIDD